MLRYHVNAQTLFLSQNKNTSPQVTDRTNYTKTTSRACTKTRAHKKLELKKQNKLCLNTHICAWNFAHNLWKDLRTHFHFCLLSFLVAPFVHRAACASWPRGLGFSRTRLDTSNSLSKGQQRMLKVSERFTTSSGMPETLKSINIRIVRCKVKLVHCITTFEMVVFLHCVLCLLSFRFP